MFFSRQLDRMIEAFRDHLPFVDSSRAAAARRDARSFLEDRRRELSDALDRFA